MPVTTKLISKSLSLTSTQVEEYREEFDSSAVRIRENKLFSTKLQEIREEIDKDSVQVKQNRPIRGELVKNKVVSACLIFVCILIVD